MYQITINGESIQYETKAAAEASIVEDGYQFQYSDNACTRSHYHNPTTGDTALVEPAKREEDAEPRHTKKAAKSKR